MLASPNAVNFSLRALFTFCRLIFHPTRYALWLQPEKHENFQETHKICINENHKPNTQKQPDNSK